MSRAIDAVPAVRVPRNDNRLAPVPTERVIRLRDHLCDLLAQAPPPGKARRNLNAAAAPPPSEPSGFAASVAAAACSLCEGWCCRNGGDDAFLDDQTLARVRRDRPELDSRGLVQLYVGRVPASAYESSCLFHGERGCALDRSLRSDLCNTYFCRGLNTYLKSGAPAAATTIIAGAGEKARTSLVPVGRPPARPADGAPAAADRDHDLSRKSR